MTALVELTLPGDRCALGVQQNVLRLKMRIAKAASRENLYLARNCRVTRPYRVLEPDESKGSNPVLRGEGGRKAPVLPGAYVQERSDTMTLLWTWSGKFFGYRKQNSLFTHDGRHVGQFVGDDIYGPDGRYLGELMTDRLIVNPQKSHWIASSWAPYASYAPIVPYVDYVGYVMYAGYEDFPPPDDL